VYIGLVMLQESFEETIKRLRQQTMDEIGGLSNSCAATSTAEVTHTTFEIGPVTNIKHGSKLCTCCCAIPALQSFLLFAAGVG
jgi:hypothetical protein